MRRENIVEKGEIEGNQQFLLFTTMFFKLSFFRSRDCVANSYSTRVSMHDHMKLGLETTCIKRPPALRDHCSDATTLLYHIPSSEILEFPGVINFDIITSDDINFHFHFLP